MSAGGAGVVRLGLGLAAVGRPAYLTSARDDDLADRSVGAMRDRSVAVLDAARAAGVRYVDTARSYGRAEEFLAGWLDADPDARADVTVASKWGYTYVGDWRLDAEVHEVKDHAASAFERQWRETRDLLGDRVAVYQVHSLTPDSPALDDPDLLARLAALRDAGVRVGFTTSGPRQADVVRRALGVEVGGARLFDVVQSTWNLLEPSVGPALAEAAEAGLQVVVKEALANGRLTDDDTAPPPAAVAAAARDLGVGVDQVAFAAAAAQPWLTRVLTGAVTTEQVDRSVAGVSLDLPPGLLDDLLRGGDVPAQPPEEYWSTRSARPWT